MRKTFTQIFVCSRRRECAPESAAKRAPRPMNTAFEQTTAPAAEKVGSRHASLFPAWVVQSIKLSACAVRRSVNNGRPRMFGVCLDRFDDQVEFIGAIDFARHAVEVV